MDSHSCSKWKGSWRFSYLLLKSACQTCLKRDCIFPWLCTLGWAQLGGSSTLPGVFWGGRFQRASSPRLLGRQLRWLEQGMTGTLVPPCHHSSWTGPQSDSGLQEAASQEDRPQHSNLYQGSVPSTSAAIRSAKAS